MENNDSLIDEAAAKVAVAFVKVNSEGKEV